MTIDPDEVMAALNSTPGFENVTVQRCRITRLGGLTNRVHRVDVDDTQIIVRIPGTGTEAYIDRATELANAKAAWRAGVSAKILWANASTGVMVSEAIPDITTMTPALFASLKGSASRAGQALARLHHSGETFEFRFELFAMIDDYLKILAGREASLPAGYDDVVQAAEPVKQALAATTVPLTPSHCDPLCENFLDDGERMWIVDWEYSGMNDPLWDVGDLAVEAGMDEAQLQELMLAYFDREPTPAEHGRVIIYMAMCDLLWTLWGLIQHADGNEAEDFWAYATTRFERCKALMGDPAFERHVQAVGSA